MRHPYSTFSANRNGGHRGGEVQCGDARAHRQRDLRVGHRGGISSVRPSRSKASTARAEARRGGSAAPSGSSAINGRSPVRTTRERATGSAKCSPAEPRSASACQGSGVPVVITPAAPPPPPRAPGAEVAEVPRRLQQHNRRGTGQRQDPVRVGLPRPPREGDDLRARDHGRERAPLPNGRRQRHVGREPGRQRRQLVRVRPPQPSSSAPKRTARSTA